MKQRFIPLYIAAVALLVPMLLAGQARGQGVGTVVSAEGALELQRAGSEQWEPALLGAAISMSDRVRTMTTGGAKILFHDDSVLDLAATTEVMVERIDRDSDAARPLSLIHLTAGKIRAVVSPAGRDPRSRYEVETPTAVTVFHDGQIIVAYDARNEVTEVVVLEGDVEVKGTLGVIGPGVTVGPQERTQVRKGRFPSSPHQSDAATLARDSEGLEILGTGSDQGVGEGHPAFNARVLRPEDLPAAVAPTTARDGSAEEAEAFGLPAQTLAERLSPDVRAHTQPIPEFRAANPGDPPSGGVDVDF